MSGDRRAMTAKAIALAYFFGATPLTGRDNGMRMS